MNQLYSLEAERAFDCSEGRSQARFGRDVVARSERVRRVESNAYRQTVERGYDVGDLLEVAAYR